MTDKWEYKFIFNPKSKLKMDVAMEKELNSLGQEGWELVSFDVVNVLVIYFILKRKLP